MEKKSEFEFIDGHRPPNDPLPRVRTYLDLSGEILGLRMWHEDDASDQHILTIERVEDRLTIRLRDIYPKNSPALCRLLGIDEQTGKRYGWPIMMAANPDIHGMDHVMVIDSEPDHEGFLPSGEISLDGIRKALAAFIEPDESSAEEFAEVIAGMDDLNAARASFTLLRNWSSAIRGGEADEAIRELFRPHSTDRPDDMAPAFEQCLKNLASAAGRYMAAPDDAGLIDLKKPVLAGIAEAEDLISGDLEYSGSSAIVHASLEREAAMLAAMAETNAAAKALLGSNDIMSDTPFGDDLEEAIVVQAEFIRAAEGESEDADEPIGEASPEVDRVEAEGCAPPIIVAHDRVADRAYTDAGIMPASEYVAKHRGDRIVIDDPHQVFKLTTGDPCFDPEGPVRINGFLYRPDRPASTPLASSLALSLILTERIRQIESEGYSIDHDDQYGMGELPLAAACYAIASADEDIPDLPYWPGQKNARWSAGEARANLWPLRDTFVGADRKRDLIKAGALICAEIERLARSGENSDGE